MRKLQRYLGKVGQAYQLARYLGWRWVLFRVWYAAKHRLNLLERAMPPYSWESKPLASWLREGIPSTPTEYLNWRRQNGPHFLFSSLPSSLPESDLIIQRADDILAGKWVYFEHEVRQSTFPPAWNTNPLDNEEWPKNEHWSHIGDFDRSDIKYLWELNRFSFVYVLVRAYARTHDDRYAEAFWTLVRNWCQDNPPQMGPNWKCGQESSIRIMAWCFGLYGFIEADVTTPEDVCLLVQSVAAHAERIEGNFSYALSTRSNHGISEAMGMWTIGLLFPELKRALTWKDLGKKTLVHEIDYQIEPDGTYTMHAINYHRSILHELLWSLRLGERNSELFPEKTYTAVRKSIDFIYQLIDMETGRLPNHGSNDGTMLLPLDDCDFSDYRPLVQLGYALTHKKRLLPEGPWDEALVWFYGAGRFDQATPPKQESSSFVNGGYYTLRGASSWAMIHAPRYHERPLHADQLHIDLWWKHLNIACDAGTFMYNAANPWNNALSKTNVHNSVTIDQTDQMTKISRFTWVNWANATNIYRGHALDGWVEYWHGEHEGYKTLPDPARHQRAIVRLGEQCWLVLDRLSASQAHLYQLQWLLSDFEYAIDRGQASIQLNTDRGVYQVVVHASAGNADWSIVRADPDSTRGWVSRYYGDREPAISIQLELETVNTWFFTLFSPPDTEIRFNENEVFVLNSAEKWQISILLSDVFSSSPAFQRKNLPFNDQNA
jgi:asparagine synthase (glutamine-hydrolysing)